MRKGEGKSAATLSLHQRILNDIEQNILTGAWPPGHRVPSEHTLTEEYNCSRMTVSKVLTQLARSGLILRRRKTGSVVLPQRTHSAILEISDVRDEVDALGKPYRHEILEREIRHPTAEECATFNLRPKQRILEITCLHFAGDQPFCLENRTISLVTVPAAEHEDFAKTSPGAWLLTHVPWSAAEHGIFADGARGKTADILKLAEGSPCLVIERRTWRTGDPVTHAKLTYPGKARVLMAHFTPSQI